MPEDEHPDPKRIVEAGYDLIGERYGKMCAAHHEARQLREEYLVLLLDRLEPGSTVLEIGSGNGLPVARALAGRHRVTGVDISGSQIEHARRQVPSPTAFPPIGRTTKIWGDSTGGCSLMEEAMKRRSRREFTDAHKAEVVALCQQGDRSIAEVARDLNLTETCFTAIPSIPR